MPLYLLLIIVFIQLLLFVNQYRTLNSVRKKDKAAEMALGTLQQWVVSNDKSVMQHIDKMNELVESLYIRTRMIDFSLRQKQPGEKTGTFSLSHEPESLPGKEHWANIFINEATHKDTLERLRQEDIHYYYTALIEELQQLNRQMSKGPVRTDAQPGPAMMAAGNGTQLNGWHQRSGRIL